MRKTVCIVTLVGIMLVLSSIPGCGGAGDDPQKVIPESPATQTVVAQKADLTAEMDVAPPQNTGPAIIEAPPPPVQEIKKNLPAESKVTIHRNTEPVRTTETLSSLQDIPDVIVIENKVYAADKKGPVTFNHVKHNKEYKIACIQCHHLYQDGKNLWKEGDRADKCVVCHDPSEEKDKATKLQNAFHKNCRDCHKEVSKEGKESPYIKCADCHG